MLIDTHCHLNFKAFKKILDQVLWQSSEAGVKKIIVPGSDLESSQKAVNLACHFIHLYAAVGIHPHHIDKLKIKKGKLINQLKKLAKNNKVVAIGECGLDYYHYPKTKYKNYIVNNKFKNKQIELFKIHLKLAKEMKLPVIIHNRLASLDIQSVINNHQSAISGVFHCFDGDEIFLKWVIKKGFYVGFDGNITYKKSLQNLVKMAPMDRILLETDSPFLTPEPLKSKKNFPNKPENIKIIAREIAKIKGISFITVVKKTTANAQKLFKFR
jgi:TatD DNase family protein